MGDGLTSHPKRVTPAAKGVLVASCGFPDMENFTLMSAHFKTWIKHAGLTWGGEALIPAAGAANVPGLLDDNMQAIRRAGEELRTGVIGAETMNAISDTGIGNEDYLNVVNSNMQGGVLGTAKTIAIGMKMLSGKAKKRREQSKK